MVAMIFKVPPHCEQCSISISNTRLRKPSLAFALRAGVRRSKPAPGGFVSSRAPAHGGSATGGRTSPWSAEGVSALTGRFAMISGRAERGSYFQGARSTPRPIRLMRHAGHGPWDDTARAALAFSKRKMDWNNDALYDPLPVTIG